MGSYVLWNADFVEHAALGYAPEMKAFISTWAKSVISLKKVPFPQLDLNAFKMDVLVTFWGIQFWRPQ